MTVKELKEKLNEFPDEMEVTVCDEIEGNDCDMVGVELLKNGGHKYAPGGGRVGEPYDVARIRWGEARTFDRS